jgi:hypothetical protein
MRASPAAHVVSGDPRETGALDADFSDFIGCLNELNVKFLLVGGYAVGAHGYVRATADIDFFYRRTSENVRRLCASLKSFGAPLNVVDFDSLMQANTITMFGQPPHRIDLLGDIDGVSFDDAWAGSIATVIGAQPLRVIGLNELIANKKASGRSKDNEDVRKLLRAGRKTP